VATEGDKPITEELLTQVIERVSSGEYLAVIAREIGFARSSFYRHLDEDKTAWDRYARARELQSECWADEINEIADDGRNDWMTIKRGGEEVEVENKEVVNRSRLRVDTRKWLMSKLHPKVYADKIAHTGPSGSGPVQIQWMPEQPKA
jgi:hypothetical protein